MSWRHPQAELAKAADLDLCDGLVYGIGAESVSRPTAKPSEAVGTSGEATESPFQIVPKSHMLEHLGAYVRELRGSHSC